MNRLCFSMLAAALLFTQTAVSAQTIASSNAEEDGNHLSFRLIPRVEGAWQSTMPEASRTNAFSLSNTALFSELDGNLTDNLYLYGQFVFADSDPAALYLNSFRPDECNWVRLFNLTWSLGNFDVTLGKDAIAFGGFEKYENEFDGYLDAYSTSWHLIQPYLWGGKLSYNFGEDQAVFFQALNSPVVVDETRSKIFQNGLMTFSAGWNGMMNGNWETMWSATYMQTGDDVNCKMLSLGDRWTAGNWQLTLDLEARAQAGAALVNNEMATLGEVRYKADKFDAFTKFGWEFCHQTECNYFSYGDDKYIEGLIVPNVLTPEKDYLFGAVGVEYFPLSNRSLRLHTIGMANNFGGFSVNVGLTCFFDFRLF